MKHTPLSEIDTRDFVIRSDVGDLMSRTNGIYESRIVIGEPTWLSIVFIGENADEPDHVVFMADAEGSVIRDQLPNSEDFNHG
jgi:hypothetical protein